MGELDASQLVLKSTSLFEIDGSIAPEMLYLSNVTDSCTLYGTGQEASGTCLTPLNMTGYASTIALGSATAGMGPGRLFGSTTGSISLTRYGELDVAPFDLKDPITLKASSNLEDAGENAMWNTVIVYTAVLDVQLEMGSAFWTVRFAFVSQQPADEDVFDGCVDEHYREKIEENSGLLVGDDTTGTYRKGDVMVCIKDSAEDACSDSEFQWLDLDSDTLVDSRPQNPLQHAFADINEPSCVNNDPGYDIGLGGYDLVARLPQTFELSAEYGDESCLRDFTYVDPLSQEESTGNTLSAEFDYDMTQSVFVEGISPESLTTRTDAEILSVLTLNQIWMRSTFEDPTAITGDDLGLDATADISVTQDETLSCSDGSDVDDQYLTGDDCTPDAQIRTDCTYAACSGDYEEMSGKIWSVSTEGGCNDYCTVQTCDDNGGSVKHIHCAPECGD